MFIVPWFSLVVFEISIWDIDEGSVDVVFTCDPEFIAFINCLNIAASLWQYYKGEHLEIVEVLVMNEIT